MKVRKLMLNFEEYPNDPNRGHNIPHMPVAEGLWSPSILVKIPEPDFSMPFNVNAVTNAVIGFLFVNAFYVLVKVKRFLK